MEQINELLRRCVREGGSDLHFKTDTGKIYMRVLGDLKEVTDAPTFNSDEFRQALHGILKQEQLDRFDKDLELDFSHEVVGVSRFRGNLYQQRHHVQAAFRVIPYEIATMEERLERLEEERKQREEAYWSRVAAGVPQDANLQPIGGER